MRVVAQVSEEDHWNHKYELLIPNNESRRWATHILKKLHVPKQYISRRQGYFSTGDKNYIARYVGTMNNDQYRAIVTTYLPYAPHGIELHCPTCSGT
jgi:hypothetical protein